MTEPMMDLRALVEKSADADLPGEMIGFAAERLMELEVGAKAGAGHGEKSAERLARRNGYRGRDWQTRAGDVELRFPKLRTGSYVPSFPEPRRAAKEALVAFAMCLEPMATTWLTPGGLRAWRLDAGDGRSRAGHGRHGRLEEPGQPLVRADRRARRRLYRHRLRPARPRARWRLVADQMRPKLAVPMDGAEEDVPAYMTFPAQHRAKLHGTNPVERLNAEIKRRTDVVGVRGSLEPVAFAPHSPTRPPSRASSARS